MKNVIGLNRIGVWAFVLAVALAAGCSNGPGQGTAKPEAAKPAAPAPDKSTVPEKAAEKAAAPEKAATKEPAAGQASGIPSAPDKDGWRSVFDGKTLAGWKETDFGEPGKTSVKDGQIILGKGNQDLTGITWAGGDLPTTNYEVEVEAMRVDGSDFFCGLTFPVKKSSCSLIVGGWGGSLVGLSCLDGYDASENETTKTMEFKDKTWYQIRVRVTDAKIQAWIDDESFVDVTITDRKVSVRWEVEGSQPFGVAAWRTKSALKNFRLRAIKVEE